MNRLPAAERDEPLYNAMLATLSFSGLAQEARELVETMCTDGVMPTVASHGAIVAGLMRCGNVDGALAAYDAACAAGISPDVRMFDVLLDGCARAGRLETLMRLCGDAEELGIRVKSYKRELPKKSPGFSPGYERLKWFLGVPNSYY
jgi:pentatricopeptide repeat protein